MLLSKVVDKVVKPVKGKKSKAVNKIKKVIKAYENAGIDKDWARKDKRRKKWMAE